jgi:hypothetical protein
MATIEQDISAFRAWVNSSPHIHSIICMVNGAIIALVVAHFI